MLINKCPICESTAVMDAKADLRICLKCNHLFKNVFVGKEAYKNYRSSTHMDLPGDHLKNSRQAALFRFKMFDAFAKKGSSVLEIGCGHSCFLDILTENGYKAEGTELSEPLVEELKYKMYLGNPSEIKDLPKYDNICAFHLIEHLNEPLKEIRCLVDHMSEDGVFVFEIPALVFYTNKLDINKIYESAHTQYFNQKSIMIMLEKCGLTPVSQVNYWSGFYQIGTALIAAVKTETADLKKHFESSMKYMVR